MSPLQIAEPTAFQNQEQAVDSLLAVPVDDRFRPERPIAVILDEFCEVERPLQCDRVIGTAQQLIKQRHLEERHIAGYESVPERLRVI